MFNKTILIAAGASLVIGAVLLVATDAEAKRGGATYQQWEFDSRNPQKGYEGFGSKSGVYCSYRREPERKCWETRSGGESCKIVSWRLIQTCK